MCFIRSHQNYLSRYHAIISYFSRLRSRKIKTFPVPWMYLIPFPAILKPNFQLSRLKKWQILRPEKALLDPLKVSLILAGNILKVLHVYICSRQFHFSINNFQTEWEQCCWFEPRRDTLIDSHKLYSAPSDHSLESLHGEYADDNYKWESHSNELIAANKLQNRLQLLWE